MKENTSFGFERLGGLKTVQSLAGCTLHGLRGCLRGIGWEGSGLGKVSICAWIYLRAFYFVPLIYISVFVPVPYCLDNCGFVVEPEVR